MPGRWSQIVGTAAGQVRRGTGGFRLMPADDMAHDQASAALEAPADGHALVLTYRWAHPTDGPQDGILLVGSLEGDGDSLEATWLDSWHQKPMALHLSGTLDDANLELSASYAGAWGWQIRLDLSAPDEISLVMDNVVPEASLDQAPSGAQMPAGPYEVMNLRLR